MFGTQLAHGAKAIESIEFYGIPIDFPLNAIVVFTLLGSQFVQRAHLIDIKDWLWIPNDFLLNAMVSRDLQCWDPAAPKSDSH